MSDIKAVDEVDTNEEELPTNEVLSMSDEEFEKTSIPPETPPVAQEAKKEEEETEEQEEENPEEDQEQEEEHSEEESEKPTKASKESKEEPSEESNETEEEEPINYEEVYKKLMAPFKANGKEIKLNSPDELIKLAQMGANYTKKMQALQPHLKIVRMLENHGLNDETQLSFLIDLHKKNPAAIQKLIKDSGIDPLDIDSQDKEHYKPNNYAVPEQDLVFSSTVEEIKDTEEGQELLQEVGKQWDKASKDIIWQQPAILQHMTAQKQTGIYQTIVAEIERKKMFGELGNIPFVQAYLEVGQQLQQAGRFNSPETKVLDTRPRIPKPKVVNNDKVRSAAPVRQNPAKSSREDFNPLAMSDDEFLKSELARNL